jgi:hypothetical protein
MTLQAVLPLHLPNLGWKNLPNPKKNQILPRLLLQAEAEVVEAVEILLAQRTQTAWAVVWERSPPISSTWLAVAKVLCRRIPILVRAVAMRRKVKTAPLLAVALKFLPVEHPLRRASLALQQLVLRVKSFGMLFALNPTPNDALFWIQKEVMILRSD